MSEHTVSGLIDAQKLANFQAGARQLSRWIDDQLTFGLAALESDPATRLEAIAAQLTDAQLPGAAEALRGFIGRVGVDASWAADLLGELGYWHLLCTLVQHPDRIAAYQLDGILVQFGLRLRKTALEETPRVHEGLWTCSGITYGERKNVFSRRTYWHGEQAGLWAEQVDFNYGAPVATTLTQVGEAGTFGVHPYPGGLPGRVVLPQHLKLAATTLCPPAYACIAEQRDASTRLLIDQPWRRSTYFAVCELQASLVDDTLVLTDTAGGAVALPAHKDAWSSWQLLAVVGSAPFTAFGTCYFGQLALLSVWQNGRLSSVS